MITEEKVLRRLIAIGQWVTTKQLDAILQEEWGEDWGMACNSMMRRGLIDYSFDGDWEILITEQDLDDMVAGLGEEVDEEIDT